MMEPIIGMAVLIVALWGITRLGSPTKPTPTSHDEIDLFDPTQTVVTLKIELSPELQGLLGRLQRETGDSLTQMLSKAITLYQMSVLAEQEGKRIGMIDDLEPAEAVDLEHPVAS